MPSLLPSDLAQRVFATHPTPFADAVWMLETASTPESQRDWILLATRTVARLLAAPILAERLHPVTRAKESKRVREIIDRWQNALLTDDEWIDLFADIARVVPAPIPFAALRDFVGSPDTLKLISTLRQILASNESTPLDELAAQFVWLTERIDALWEHVQIVVPEEPPKDEHARQIIHAQYGLADTRLFEELTLQEGTRAPAGQPVMASPDGQVLMPLHPVMQWMPDVAGAGDSLFILEGVQNGAELLRSYPSLVEQHGPRMHPKQAPPPTKDRRQPRRRAVWTGVGVTLIAGAVLVGWQHYSARQALLAAEERFKAADERRAQENTAEKAFADQMAKGIAKAEASAAEAATGLVPSLRRGRIGQEALEKLADALAKSDNPKTRMEWLEKASRDHWYGWTDALPPPASTWSLNQQLPDGNTAVVISQGRPIEVMNLENGKTLRSLQDSKFSVTSTCLSRNGKLFAGVREDGVIHVWDVTNGRAQKALSTKESKPLACAFRPDTKRIATSHEDGSIRSWDAASGATENTFKLDKPAHELLFLQDDSLVAHTDSDVMVLQPESGDVRVRLPSSADSVLSGSGTRFAVSTSDSARTVDWQPPAVITLEAKPTSIAWAPAGTRFVSAGVDLRLHAGEGSGRRVQGVGDEEDWKAVRFAPDGTVFAALAQNGSISLLKANGDRSFVIPPGSTASRVFTFSPDATTLAVAEGGAISEWSIEKQSTLKTYATGSQDPITSIAFSPDGTQFAACHGQLSAWKLSNGKKIELAAKKCDRIAFSPVDGSLAVVSDRALTLWPKGQSKSVELMPAGDQTLTEVTFTPDGTSLFATDGRHIWWFDVESTRPRTRLPGLTEPVTSLAISADGLWLSTGPQLVFLPTAMGPELRTLAPGASPARVAEFSLDGRTVALADDKRIQLVSVSDGRVLKLLSGHEKPVTTLDFARDGHTLLSGSADHTLREWDLSSGKQKRIVRLDGSVTKAAYTAIGQEVIVAMGKNVLELDLASGDVLRTIQGHSEEVLSMVLANTHRTLATASDEGSVRLWDLKSGSLVAEIASQLAKVKTLAYSADGQWLAMGRDDGQLMLRTADGQGSWFPAHEATVSSLAFSPDGRLLVSAASDKSVRVWQLKRAAGIVEAKAHFTLEGHSASVTHITFSPDGSWFASTSEDRTVRLWNAPALESFFAASPRALLAQSRAVIESSKGPPALSARRVER